jgi:hypothetical protein
LILWRGKLSAGTQALLSGLRYSAIASVPPGPLSNGYAIFVLHPPPLFQGKLAVIEISAISDDTFSGATK